MLLVNALLFIEQILIFMKGSHSQLQTCSILICMAALVQEGSEPYIFACSPRP